jgi:hypothetical protein
VTRRNFVRAIISGLFEFSWSESRFRHLFRRHEEYRSNKKRIFVSVSRFYSTDLSAMPVKLHRTRKSSTHILLSRGESPLLATLNSKPDRRGPTRSESITRSSSQIIGFTIKHESTSQMRGCPLWGRCIPDVSRYFLQNEQRMQRKSAFVRKSGRYG